MKEQIDLPTVRAAAQEFEEGIRAVHDAIVIGPDDYRSRAEIERALEDNGNPRLDEVKSGIGLIAVNSANTISAPDRGPE